MPENKNTLRSVVLAWTILTTTFFWTSTMRILMKPEISSWSLFNTGGKGMEGAYWLVKIAVASTILQWIMLAEALGRPYKAGKQEQA